MSAGNAQAPTSAEQLPEHRTATVASGDVELFYRSFGEPGQTPVLIFHGGNYYDSYDWIPVAAALAADRQVVAYDARGFGESGWSPSQDYSLDANLDDVATLLEHLGWESAIFVAHSRGSSFALRFAFEHPERVASMVIVDYTPARAAGRLRDTPIATGAQEATFKSLEAALASSSRDQGALADPVKRARLEMFYAPGDGGWVNVKRDPALNARPPKDQSDRTPRYGPIDLWDAVTSLTVPTLLIWATKSGIYDEQRLAQFREHLPAARIAGIESGHDVCSEAPRELIAALKDFL